MVPGERERKKILDPYLNIDAFETETLCLFWEEEILTSASCPCHLHSRLILRLPICAKVAKKRMPRLNHRTTAA